MNSNTKEDPSACISVSAARQVSCTSEYTSGVIHQHMVNYKSSETTWAKFYSSKNLYIYFSDLNRIVTHFSSSPRTKNKILTTPFCLATSRSGAITISFSFFRCRYFVTSRNPTTYLRLANAFTGSRWYRRSWNFTMSFSSSFTALSRATVTELSQYLHVQTEMNHFTITVTLENREWYNALPREWRQFRATYIYIFFQCHHMFLWTFVVSPLVVAIV